MTMMTPENTGGPVGYEGRDVTKSSLPRREWRELAEDLLARFPGVDQAELLKRLVMSYFFEMKYGNKREERAACDFLNEVQRVAIALRPKADDGGQP